MFDEIWGICGFTYKDLDLDLPLGDSHMAYFEHQAIAFSLYMMFGVG